MALNVGDIRTRITAKDETKAAFASANRNLGNLKNGVSGVAGKFLALSGAIAGIAGVASLTELTKEGLEYADALAKAADKLGVMTTELQALRRAAEFAGVGTSVLENSMQKIARRTAEAVERGVGPAADALKTLGINAQDLNAQNPAQQIETVLAALGELESQNDKIYLSDALFGKKGVDLLLLTGDAIKTATEEIDRFGLGLSRVDAAGIEAANDAMARLSLQTQGVGQQFAAGIAPAVEATAIAMLEASGAASDWAEAGANAGTVWTSSLVFMVDLYNTLRVLLKETKALALDGALAISEAALAINGFLGDDTSAQERAILQTKINIGELRSEIEQIKIDGSFADEMTAAMEQVRANAETTAAKIEALRNSSGKVTSVLGNTGQEILGKASDTKAIERELQRIINANLSPFQKAAAEFAKAQGTIDEALAKNLGDSFDASAQRAANYSTLVSSIVEDITGKLNLASVTTEQQLGAAEAEGMLQLSQATDQANLSQQAQLAVTQEVIAALNAQRETVALLAAEQAATAALETQQNTFGAIGGDSNSVAFAQEQLAQQAKLDAIAEGWNAQVDLGADYFQVIEEQTAAHQDRLVALYQQGGEKITAFQKLNSKTQRALVIGDLRDITASLASENRAAFDIQKAFAATDAAQNAISAVMRAYAWGSRWGPWAGAAAAAPAAVFGAAQVSAILNQSFGDTASSASPSSGGSVGDSNTSTDNVSAVQNSGASSSGPQIINNFSINSITAEQAAIGYLQGKQAARELNMEQGGDTDFLLNDNSGLLSGVN